MIANLRSHADWLVCLGTAFHAHSFASSAFLMPDTGSPNDTTKSRKYIETEVSMTPFIVLNFIYITISSTIYWMIKRLKMRLKIDI